MAKGQDYFCPISQLIPKAKIPNPDDVGLWLKVRLIKALDFREGSCAKAHLVLMCGWSCPCWLDFNTIIIKHKPPSPVLLCLRQVNGETRQQSSTKHMIRKTASLISYISHLFTLEPGDVILTGKSRLCVCKWGLAR